MNLGGNTTNKTANAVVNNVKNATNGVMNSIITTYNKVNNAINSAVENTVKNTQNIASNVGAILPEPIQNSFNAIPNTAPTPWVSLPLIVSLGALIIAMILFMAYREQFSVMASRAYEKLRDIFGATTRSDIPPQSPEDSTSSDQSSIVNKVLPSKKEVFNVSQNIYTYNDAEPLCKSLGAELATYEQVKEAWNRGADWCNYGWVKGQSAVYPTQKDTWDKLQSETDDQRMACGTIGVNGGYFDNPDLRFGVNCYGTKPAESTNDAKIIQSHKFPPSTPSEIEFEKKVSKYAAEKDQIGILPFKQGIWSS
jgi:hypothetical protein